MTNFIDFLQLEAHPANAPALWDDGRWYHYGDLVRRMRQVATFVRSLDASGARPIVALAGANSFGLVAAYLGVLHAGAIAVPLPPLPDAPLRDVLAEIQPLVVIADHAWLPTLARIGGCSVHPLELPYERDDTQPPRDVEPDDLALLLYTSGSTGRPRGVCMSLTNLTCSAAQILTAVPISARDRAVVTLPFHYTYALSVLHTHLRAGASLVLAKHTFVDDLVDLIETHKATALPVVPSTLNLLVGRGALAARRLESLRDVTCSGGRLVETVARELIATQPHVALHIRYGVTEATAAASYLEPDRLADKLGSIGRGLPNAPLAVERDDGSPILPGSREEGTIVIRGPHVTLGYLRDDSRRAFARGGYITGDIARIDADGFVYIVGRTTEFIKTGGHRVAPQQIEEVLASMPGVAEVGVFATSDATRGEALVAAIVTCDGAVVQAKALRSHCTARLPAFMVPTRFVVVAALPKGVNGKLDRARLVQLGSAPDS
jgi:long-chain acyl-CoA synthetase